MEFIFTLDTTTAATVTAAAVVVTSTTEGVRDILGRGVQIP